MILTDYRHSSGLRDSKFKGDASYDEVRQLAMKSLGSDEEGYRADFLTMVAAASRLPKSQEVAGALSQTRVTIIRPTRRSCSKTSSSLPPASWTSLSNSTHPRILPRHDQRVVGRGR